MSTPTATEPAAIRVCGVTHDYDGQVVLKDVTCLFPVGKIVVLVGETGCGKTTFLRCLAGLLDPSSGNISLGGMEPRQVRRSGHIGFAFQSATLLPWRTALENVLLPLEIIGHAADRTSVDYAEHLLKLVELDGKDILKYPNELSGGMQQRVGLARALVTKPRYLCLDEPFGSLDPGTRDRLNEKVRELSQQFSLTTICVTHSPEEAVFLGDQVIVFKSSRGAPTQVGVEMDLSLLGTSRDASTRCKKDFLDFVMQLRAHMRSLAEASKI